MNLKLHMNEIQIVFFFSLCFNNSHKNILVPDYYTWDINSGWDKGTNTLGLVIFGIVLGITVGKMGEQGKPLLDFFYSLSEAMMIITNWVIW